MGLRIPHLDADESAFFERSIAHVKSRTYDVKYPNLMDEMLFPVSEEAPGAPFVAYETYDQIGMAKVITSYTDDIPFVGIKGKEFVAHVRTLAAGYMYSTQDVRAAKAQGLDLDAKKAAAAKRAIKQLQNEITFTGDAANNIIGLFQNENVTRAFAAKGGGASATTKWSTKTGDEMLDDMNRTVNIVNEASLGVHKANVLLMPISHYNLAATKRLTQNPALTVLAAFKESNPDVQVYSVPQIQGKGADGGDVLVAYERNEENCELQICLDFTQGDAQTEGLTYKIPCEERFGGLLIFYPLAFAILQGL